jgi:hypothetical protein
MDVITANESLIEMDVIYKNRQVGTRTFNLSYDNFDAWKKTYPVNERIETPVSVLYLKDLQLDGPILSLSVEESTHLKEHYRSYFIIVTDNFGNQYEASLDALENGVYQFNFGSIKHYTIVDYFDIHVTFMFYENQEFIGTLEDSIDFTHENVNYRFNINRQHDKVAYFELIPESPTFTLNYPTLLIREKGYWLKLHHQVNNQKQIITSEDDKDDFNSTYDYFKFDLGILLNKSELNTKYEELSQGQSISVSILDTRKDMIRFRSYFGDTSQPLELAIFYGHETHRIDKDFRIKIK